MCVKQVALLWGVHDRQEVVRQAIAVPDRSIFNVLLLSSLTSLIWARGTSWNYPSKDRHPH